MTSRVLARLYRPKSFDTLVGQNVVVKALSNAIGQKRLHHAYLLTGTRGVGKTTIARILAKCLNCNTGQTTTPCETCTNCQQINDNRFLDLIEIDAASKTKVEDTRELLDNVQYAPNQGRYKVYLIDEVHMLSNHSFNALLKTLEEPPSHCLFILATTDPQKIPATVISRCIQLKLSALTPDEIVGQLAHVLQQEKIHFEQDALQLLAKAANGSMRDALSLTDQAIAYSEQTINLDAVSHMLGIASQEPLLTMLKAIVHNEAHTLINIIQDTLRQGARVDALLDAFISLCHTAAMRQAIPQYPCNAITNEAELQAIIDKVSAETLQLYYQIALMGRKDMQVSPDITMAFEMTMLRMITLNHQQSTKQIDIQQGKTRSSSKIDSTTSSHNAPPEKTPSKPEPDTKGTQSNQVAPSPQQSAVSLPCSKTSIAYEPSKLQNQWHIIVTQLPLKGLASSLIQQSTVSQCKPPELTLILPPNLESMLTPAQQSSIQEAITQSLEGIKTVHMYFEQSSVASPLEREQQAKQNQLEARKDQVMQSPLAKDLVSEMGATIIDETVTET